VAFNERDMLNACLLPFRGSHPVKSLNLPPDHLRWKFDSATISQDTVFMKNTEYSCSQKVLEADFDLHPDSRCAWPLKKCVVSCETTHGMQSSPETRKSFFSSNLPRPNATVPWTAERALMYFSYSFLALTKFSPIKSTTWSGK
jgi:hypothetical protein